MRNFSELDKTRIVRLDGAHNARDLGGIRTADGGIVRRVREYAEVYSHFFSLLMSGGVPLLFHCTAGKDRTGFAAAMLLSSLGVSREDIFRDYMMSAEGAG